MKATEETVLYKKLVHAKASTVLRFTKTPYTSEVELEKHPSYMLGVVEFTPEIKTLTDYSAASSGNMGLTLSYKKL